jgi:flagellar hook-length control protein FliK
MQVGGLGMVSSITLQKGNPIQQNADDFSSIFSEMIQLEEVTTDPVSLNNSEISNNELSSLIMTFLKDLQSDNVKMDSEIFQEELSYLKSQLQDMNIEEVLMSFIHILSFINGEVTNRQNQDNNFTDLQKNSKVTDLLTALQNSDKDHKQIKDLLQKVTEKLEAVLSKSNNSNRIEYLEKVFASPVRERKEYSTSVMQSRVTLSLLNSTILKDNVGVKSNSIHFGPVNTDPFFIQNLIKPETLTLIQGQTGKQVSTEQLIQQFESILSKSQFNSTLGQNRLFIKLYPEHLGPLRIELIQKDSMMIAKLMTTTSTAKELLESQLQSLKQAFSSQNIQVERIDISNGAQFQERLINKDPQQQQQQQNQEKQHQDENDQDLEHSFSEVLLNVEV